MNEDEFERDRQKAREKWQNSQVTRIFAFLAIWWLPLFGMELQGKDTTPAIGPLSMYGFWFLAVPTGFWIYCRLNRP